MKNLLFILLCLSANIAFAQSSKAKKRPMAVKMETEATNTDFEILTKSAVVSGGCGAVPSMDYKCLNPFSYSYILGLKPLIDNIEVIQVKFGKKTVVSDYKGVRPKDEMLRFATSTGPPLNTNVIIVCEYKKNGLKKRLIIK